jgi:hypothetical protein
MILFYLNNKNQKQAKFIRYLFRSYTGEKHIQPTNRFDSNARLNLQAKWIVFAGIIRGEGLIYKYCKENNKKFLYVDHAYVDRGYNKVNEDLEWMRITPSSFTWHLNQPESNDRWEEFFGKKYQLSPWNSKQGKNILVLPPSEATKMLFPESEEWVKNTIEEISKHTSAPIVIREKPEQPVIDTLTNQVIDRKIITYENSIEKEMLDAKCIVTFNSAVPVLGTILGIPCYCSPHAAAYPMNVNLNYINDPPEPKRQEWLNQLVYHQYKTSEMKNGKVWKLLEKYMR